MSDEDWSPFYRGGDWQIRARYRWWRWKSLVRRFHWEALLLWLILATYVVAFWFCIAYVFAVSAQ